MRNTFLIVLLTSLALGCGPSTKLMTSLEAPEVQPKKYNKLAVLAFLPARTNRAVVEEAVEQALLDEGIKGRVTFDMFPLAGDRDIIEKMDLNPEELKAVIRQKVTDNNIDGLLTISLLDTQSEERYVEGASFTVGVPLYAVDPIYAYTYYDYYTYAYRTVSKPGYYVQSTTYFLESNLYDIASERLLWTGQTKTKDPSSIAKEAIAFGKIIVQDILRKKIVAR